MKKVIILVLSVIVLPFANATYAQLNDGNYTGVAQGKEGPVTVHVSVNGGKIDAIQVAEHHDTDILMDGVIENIIPAIIENQDTKNIDAVTGATYSSNGVIGAVNDAMGKAKK